ncbi:MAG: DUF5694 domain-containing protein, partial [Lysobacter sp.]
MLLACQGAVAAQVDLGVLDRKISGQPTQVLVLGSVHLNNAPKDFKRESLEPVLDRLAAFKPTIITIEAISGQDCDLMARHPAVYPPEDLKWFCLAPTKAKAATGLDIPEAIAEVQRLLKDWPAAPTPAQRRRLAAMFLASADNASAVVQWLQLPESERHTGDGLDDALVALLEKQMTYNSESEQIGARLAARLGLQRVFPIDDHTGDGYDGADAQAFGKAIQQAWDGDSAAKRLIARQDELVKSGDMLAVYRFINDPATLRIRIDGDFGAT